MTTIKTTINPYSELRFKMWKCESMVAFLAEIYSLEDSNWIEMVGDPMTEWDFSIWITEAGEKYLKDIPAQITLLNQLAKSCIESGLMHRFEKTENGWQVIWTKQGQEAFEKINEFITSAVN